MIHPELLRTEIETGYLKMTLREALASSDVVEGAMADFEEVYMKDLGGKIKGLRLIEDDEDLESKFLLNKRRIFEHKAWIDLFSELVSEMHLGAYESSRIEKRKYKILDALDLLLAKMLPFEDKILEIRHKRLSKNLDKEAAIALGKIEALLKKSQKSASPEQERKLLVILKNQELVFKSFVQLLHTQFEKWEKTVVRNGRGFLFSDLKKFPFSGMYTMQGDFYIILEVMGHLLGYGFGKVACRCVHLQSGQVFALIKSRTEYPETKNPLELKEKIEKNFLLTWKESETLNQLRDKQGILQIRERMAFRLKDYQELYFVEDYFADGNLEKYFKEVFTKKKEGPSFDESFRIGFQLLTALKSIHQEGYVHFDIKAENILIDFHNYAHFLVSIADFNTSKTYRDQLTFANIGHSTKWCPPEYASFHLYEDKKSTYKPVGPLIFRFDVWSMGLVLYCLYFQEWFPWAPLNEQETYETISKLQEGWIPKHFSKHPYYPLIEKMLKADPNKRLTSAQALDMFMEISKRAAPKKRKTA